MKNSLLSAILVGSSFSASATTTIDLKGFNGTLINNQWFNFGGTLYNPGGTGFETANMGGNGSVFLSPIVDVSDSSHIHVNGGSGAGSDATPYIHGDVGGVFVSGSGSLSNFSFQSMDVLAATNLHSDTLSHPNATLTVRGFSGGVNGMIAGIVETDGTTMQYNGGAQVAEATINNGFTGTYNFLAADAGFGNVDYVEFFFTDFYRTLPSSLGDGTLEFQFDNIVVGPVSTVPVPATVWLFATGIMGLLSFNRKKTPALVA